MIDWEATKEQSGTIDLDSYRPKVICRCDSCDDIKMITIRVKSKIKNNQMEWWCTKCVGSRQEVKDKLSKSTKNQWNKIEYAQGRSESSKNLWEDEKYRARHKAAVQSDSNRKKCSDAAIKAWQDESYREAHAVALAKALITKPSTEVRFDSILHGLEIAFESNFVVGPYTFDYKIDRPNRPTLLIEINGNYWHTRPKVMRKDKAKSSYMSDIKEYEMKTIWEHQLFDIDRLKELLLLWMGTKSDAKHVDLNVISYRLADLNDMKDFMSNYHYLGSMGRSGVLVGGYVDEQLICGAVLAHPTRKEMYTSMGLRKGDVLELTRFAISPFVRNKNMASHFLSRLPRFVQPEIKALISYSDVAAGHVGTIYKAANWDFVGETTSSYFYINGDGWKLHKKTLYNRARSMHVKEREFAVKYKYNKIHTPPIMKFVYTIKRK